MSQLILLWILANLGQTHWGLDREPACVADWLLKLNEPIWDSTLPPCDWTGGTEVAVEMGSERSRFGRLSLNRAHNIELAASKLDGVRIPGGGVFAFNAALGRRTAEAGFLEAGVFVGGGLARGLGGGVCQVASTLHVAALQAGMEILERWPHRFQVGYVPVGQDAAVNWGTRDLVFRNPFPFPVTIRTEVVDSRNLVVRILGPARVMMTKVEVKELERKAPSTVKLKKKATWLTPIEYRGRDALKVEVVVKRKPIWGKSWHRVEKREDSYRSMPWVIAVAEYPAGGRVLKGVTKEEMKQLLDGKMPNRFLQPAKQEHTPPGNDGGVTLR